MTMAASHKVAAQEPEIAVFHTDNERKETESNDPNIFAKLLTKYSKCCPRDVNNYNRRQGVFPLMQFISNISVEGGNRVERAFKMMWEREHRGGT